MSRARSCASASSTGSGQSIPGVNVHVAKWRGNKALYNHRHPNVLNTQIPYQSNEAGSYQWTWAPDDAVTYTFWKEGYQSRDASLVADGKEQTITLEAILRLTGKVTDAATGRPIEKVTAIPVADNPYGALRVERCTRGSSPAAFTRSRATRTGPTSPTGYGLRLRATGRP